MTDDMRHFSVFIIMGRLFSRQSRTTGTLFHLLAPPPLRIRRLYVDVACADHRCLEREVSLVFVAYRTSHSLFRC
jgi:hypothetical protein